MILLNLYVLLRRNSAFKRVNLVYSGSAWSGNKRAKFSFMLLMTMGRDVNQNRAHDPRNNTADKNVDPRVNTCVDLFDHKAWEVCKRLLELAAV
jgi:hypothetical protein